MSQVVELAELDLWAVMHTASETMFAPVFRERLPAEIFALWYARHKELLPTSYLESYQAQLAQEITLFLYAHTDKLSADADEILDGFDKWRSGPRHA